MQRTRYAEAPGTPINNGASGGDHSTPSDQLAQNVWQVDLSICTAALWAATSERAVAARCMMPRVFTTWHVPLLHNRGLLPEVLLEEYSFSF